MSFSTLTFFLFLAFNFVLYWLLRTKARQNIQLVVASFVFYAWWDWKFCLLLFGSSWLDFFVGQNLAKTENPSHRRRWLLVSCVGNLGLLGYFKYVGFFVYSTTNFLHSIGFQTDPTVLNVILPVGISFYTFQTLSYSIDIYRRELEPSKNLIDYMAFVSFFPQLVAGPIERATHLLPALSRDRTFNYLDAKEGCRYILWGLFKKMAIADNLSGYVKTVYSNPSAYTGPQLIIATVMFAFQIYCDFSAYSDIAIGTARLFGIHLMRNFSYPYFSQSVGEFWRRWHISLSTWFRDYVYIPLGGSRVSRPRMAFNLLLTFGLSGFWHGASWNFIIWGLLNGLGLLPLALWPRPVEKDAAHKSYARGVPGGERLIPTVATFIRMLACFAFICLTWVFFVAKTLPDALMILQRMVVDLPHRAAWHGLTLNNERNLFVIPLLALMVGLEWLQRRHPHPLHFPWLPRPARWTVYTIVIWATLILLPRQSGAFIYFQF